MLRKFFWQGVRTGILAFVQGLNKSRFIRLSGTTAGVLWVSVTVFFHCLFLLIFQPKWKYSSPYHSRAVLSHDRCGCSAGLPFSSESLLPSEEMQRILGRKALGATRKERLWPSDQRWRLVGAGRFGDNWQIKNGGKFYSHPPQQNIEYCSKLHKSQKNLSRPVFWALKLKNIFSVVWDLAIAVSARRISTI